MEEIWRDVKGYEGYYQVSNMGRIKRIPIEIESARAAGVRVFKEKILFSSPNYKGYHHVGLSKNGKVKSLRVHRLVAENFVENPNNYPEVNHINEIKSDNRAINLEWCTHVYNINYGTGKWRQALKTKGISNPKNQGERCGTSKLKSEQVISIYYSKIKYKDLCQKYNVGMACISRIKNKKYWKHILKNL